MCRAVRALRVVAVRVEVGVGLRFRSTASVCWFTPSAFARRAKPALRGWFTFASLTLSPLPCPRPAAQPASRRGKRPTSALRGCKYAFRFNYENVIEYEKHSQTQRGHGQATHKASGAPLGLAGSNLLKRLNLANTKRSQKDDSGSKRCIFGFG